MKSQASALVNAIRLYHDVHGYGPSIRDLADITEMSSTSVVVYWLRKLRDDGLVTYDDNVARSIRVTGMHHATG